MTRAARLTAVVLAVPALIAAPLVVASSAHAATYTVTTTADSGAGSLRQAITDANGNLGPDVIDFAPGLSGQTIELDSVIIITETLVIEGPGSGALTIARSGAFDSDLLAFQPSAAENDLTVQGLTFDGDGASGGAALIVNDNAAPPRNLALDDVVVRDMWAIISGAGVFVDTISGSVSVSDSTFINNASGASGAAIRAQSVAGQVSITDSVFTGNTAQLEGGAVSTNGPAGVRIERSQFTGNASETGGAVAVRTAGPLTVDESTFVGNTGTSVGGGLFVDTVGQSSSITASTFRQNNGAAAGGGVYIGSVTSSFTTSTSLFDRNFALNSQQGGAYGGGLYIGSVAAGASATIDSSTFTGHRLDPGLFGNGSGLGLAVMEMSEGSEVAVVNSTLSETAQSLGGAIYWGDIEPIADATIGHTTIVAEVGIRLSGFPLTVHNSILVSGAVAGEGASVLAGAPSALVSYSVLSGGQPLGVIDVIGNQFMTDALLGPLTDNGGPTPTRLPAATSPALNAGDPAFAGTPITDQRGDGFPRVLQGRIDAGAVESDAELAATGAQPLLDLALAMLALLVVGGALMLMRRAAMSQTRGA